MRRYIFIVLVLLAPVLVANTCDLDTRSTGETDRRPTKFNRNIDDEAHQQIERMLGEGIAEFAFHPDGGWVVVTEQGNKFARNIPEECNQKLEAFLARGHTIESTPSRPTGATVGLS